MFILFPRTPKNGKNGIKNGIFSAVFIVSGNNYETVEKQAYPSNRPKAKYVNVSFFFLQFK
jgi:hypothetical protein